MADTEESRALRLHIQVLWEMSMDHFYESVDKMLRSCEVDEVDVIAAISRQIDPETADCYQEWIEG